MVYESARVQLVWDQAVRAARDRPQQQLLPNAVQSTLFDDESPVVRDAVGFMLVWLTLVRPDCFQFDVRLIYSLHYCRIISLTLENYTHRRYCIA